MAPPSWIHARGLRMETKPGIVTCLVVPASILLLTYPQQDGSPGTADPCHVSMDKGPGWLFYCFNVWFHDHDQHVRYPGSVPLG